MFLDLDKLLPVLSSLSVLSLALVFWKETTIGDLFRRRPSPPEFPVIVRTWTLACSIPKINGLVMGLDLRRYGEKYQGGLGLCGYESDVFMNINHGK